MKSPIIATIFLGVCTLAGWSAPAVLFESEAVLRGFSSFVDESGLTHTAYCLEDTLSTGDVKASLIYRRTDSKNQVLREVDFQIATGCRSVAIHAGGKGGEIVLAYEGTRKPRSLVCNQTHTAGCHDVFVGLSKDSGNVWTPFKAVQRKNMDDAVEREKLKFLLNWVLKEVHLYYIQRHIETGKVYASYVRKEEDDAEFGREHSQWYDNEYDLIGVMVTKERRAVASHRFSREGGKYHHRYDFGGMVTNAAHFDWKDRYTQFLAASNEETAAVVSVATNGSSTFLRYSSDHGVTWSRCYVIDEKYHKVATGVLVGKGGREYELAVMTTGFMSDSLTFRVVKLLKGAVTNPVQVSDPDPPFADIKNLGIFAPQLYRYTGNKEGYAYRAFAHIWKYDSRSAVYVSDYRH